MILLPGLLFVLWGEPGQCLEEGGGFKFNGDIRHFAVATNTVYIATEERMYQLSHDLTLVQSLTQRGILKGAERVEDERFYRVSETDEGNATSSVNILSPFVENDTLISCSVTDNECGYCELLDLKNISNVLYMEQILVGSPWRSSVSVSFLVKVEKTQTQTETYILAAVQQDEDKPTKTSCSPESEAVMLHNTNNKQRGEIFSFRGDSIKPAIYRKGAVEFVDGFQISSIIYLFSNLPSKDKSNKVRLLWFEAKTSKLQTVRSLRGATLSISDGGNRDKLLASSVIPGGPPVLWSGVFSVDGGQTNTELVVFDISPDLTGDTDVDPDFCSRQTCTDKSTPKTLKPKRLIFRQNDMTSVLAVRQKAWMVFFIGTGDGQLIKLAVDKNYHTACPRVLYRANDDRQVFPKIQLDPVDHKHVYVPFKNQMERVPVSKCSTYMTVQDCWSAQDPYCVWCSSKKSCTFEDDCPDSDWLSIPDDSHQQKMVSYKVVEDSSGQITFNIQTHVTVGQEARSNFACQFAASSIELCSRASPRPLFPQCTCILKNITLPAEGLRVAVRIRLGTTQLLEQLKISNCSDISGPPTSVLCQQCIEAGCGWSKNGCSWANHREEDDSVCPMMESGNFSKPEISSITPSIVSFYGTNHAVLSGRNLGAVTRVRIQVDMDCTPQEFPVWNNYGVNLTFNIPSADMKGVVKVCVVLPDGSCHGKAKITYRSSPSCINITPNSSWVSGKRKITLTGSHLELVERVVHSHTKQEIRPPTNTNFQNLTYETPAAGNLGILTSSVFLKVGKGTLACSTITYYPDPEFTSFETAKTGDDVRITMQKKADELEITPAELTVWGIHEGKRFSCIMKDKRTSDNTDFFICEIQSPPVATFQNLEIIYGDMTVTLGAPSLIHHILLILVILLIPCVIAVLVIICRWQKKLTAV